MNQQLDKFFRDKLYRFEKPVSGDLWERVSSVRNKGSRKFTWLKVAAALLVVALSTVLVFNRNEHHGQAITENSVQDSVRSDHNSIRETREDTAADAAKEVIDTPRATQPVIALEENARTAPQQNPAVHQEPALPAKEVPPAHPVTAGIIMDTPPGNAQTDQHAEAMDVQTTDRQARKTVTIVFDADEVNEKYLTKRPATDATASAKETSGLKRLLEKAQDLKHNQDPIGELRQMKNEILALNFRNEKQHHEN